MARAASTCSRCSSRTARARTWWPGRWRWWSPSCAPCATPARCDAAPGPARPRGPGRLLHSGRKQALEEAAVALQRDAQVLGGDVVPAAPLLLERLALGGEALGEPAHQEGDELVGLLDRPAGLVHEPGLDRLPARAELSALLARQQL